MFDIEFADPSYGNCSCCGAEQVIFTRFVSRLGSPFCIYKASVTNGPHARVAEMVLSIGNWSEDSISAERTAFAIQLRAEGSVVNVGIVEPHQIPWHSDFWGKLLSREQALLSDWLPSVFELMDKISRQDELLIGLLERGQEG